jgi:hypothetical protein
MIVLVRRWVQALLYDEDKAQRALAMALVGLGMTLESGGIIPGTDAVIPGLATWHRLGPLLKLAGIYLGAGGRLSLPGEQPKP